MKTPARSDAPARPETDVPSERERFEFDKEKFRQDQALKADTLKQDMALKRLDFWRSPLTLAIFGAILSLVAGVATSFFNNQNQLRVEGEKFQSDLIKQFLEPPEVETRKANLQFLAESGLIPHFGAAIKDFLVANKANPDALPRTLAPGKTDQLTPLGSFGADNRIDDATFDKVARARSAIFTIEKHDDGPRWTRCSGFLIHPAEIVTATYCVPGAIEAGGIELSDLRIAGSAADATAKPAIASVAIVGGNDPIRSFAVITLAAPFAGAEPLPVAAAAPEIGERLILVYSSAPGKFAAALDDECTISGIDDKTVAYRCDASPGSSGAPVISMTSGNVVAVHNRTDNDARYGVRLDVAGLPRP